jgi:3-hydroxyisobutyrate dehydrogenase-like beta-hydroxyacid dehydrogenase
MRITVLHPGQMGVEVARCLSQAHEVAWCGQGRSAATRQRAEGADLLELADLGAVASWSDALISVCPPAAAHQVAADVVAAGFAGLYVDANAVSPATVQRIAATVTETGGELVDGGIVGLPPRQEGTTRLFVSGPRAGEVAGWFAGGTLGTVVLAGDVGAASALKASYAGWTKASAALLVAVRAHARAAGVEDALLEEWDRSQPGLRDRSDGALARLLTTAWRYEGEMAEIATSMDDHGVPAEFHDGAAAVYRRLARVGAGAADVARVLDEFLAP